MVIVEWCVCVCVCNPLNEHVVVNSALYVVTVNGKDAPKWKFWAETENSGCSLSKIKTEFFLNNYLFY